MTMTTFESVKKEIMVDMEKTLKKEFMDMNNYGEISWMLTVEEKVAFLNDDDDVYESYGELIKDDIDEYCTIHVDGCQLYKSIKSVNKLSTFEDCCPDKIIKMTQSIMDDMYDEIDNEYGSDDLKPSMIIPRWSYEILTDYVCVTDIFEECFEKEGEIKAGVVAFQSLWRGYDCRWKNPFMLLKESVDE